MIIIIYFKYTMIHLTTLGQCIIDKSALYIYNKKNNTHVHKEKQLRKCIWVNITLSLKVKQIRVGPTFIFSTKDVVAASNCYVHCFQYHILLSFFVKMQVCEH